MIAVDLVRDPDEVVVDVAEVVVTVGLQPRQIRDDLGLPGEQVPHRDDGPSQLQQQALEAERLLQLLAAAAGDDRVLEAVDLLVEVAEDREVAVHDHVDDLVDVVALGLGRRGILQQRAHLAQILEALGVHGDDELAAEVAVHLLQRVVVLVLGVQFDRALQHEERPLAVHVELGALPHALGVLDRERMPAEQGAEPLHVFRGRGDQVEPEELALPAQLCDQGFVDGVEDAHVRSR